MLEGKTANNIVDRYHRIITGDQGNLIESGSCNYIVRDIPGTLQGPFANIPEEFKKYISSYADLVHAVDDNNATVKLTIQGSSVGLVDFEMYLHANINSSWTNFYGTIINFGGSIETCQAAEIILDNNGVLNECILLMNGEIINGTSLFENVPTSVTIIYHPVN